MGDFVMVDACLRGDAGGSPTAVVLDAEGAADDELMRIARRTGASHVAAVYPAAGPEQVLAVRFFTATEELPGCGHGTVSVVAVLALQGPGDVFRARLSISGRQVAVSGDVERRGTAGPVVTAWFDQGLVSTRAATEDERGSFLDALRLDARDLSPEHDVTVASPGRERLLVPVTDRSVLARMHPHQERLAAASRRFGQLGCFVHVAPSTRQSGAARMLAPAIGVPEDVANANSTGCLAAVLLLTGHHPTIAVEQGDALGRPSTVYATARETETGVFTRVGGAARVAPEP